MKNKELFEKPNINPNDVVYTPSHIAKLIVDNFNPSGICLEPCRGLGAFYNLLPEGSLWCEIADGKDFFDFDGKVDWIVTNPPYSNFDKFLEHSFAVADNVIFLVPFAKVFKSIGTMRKVFEYGGIVEVLAMAASKAGFPFGFPCGAFHFKRGYKGSTKIVMV